MSASRSSPAAALAAAAVGLLLLSSVSSANSYEQVFPGRAPGAIEYESRAYDRGYSWDRPATPSDFSSSHVCIDGYRWITRHLEQGEDPAENAVPVRCN